MKLVEILHHRENFNQVEEDIAKFVLDDPKSVINLSVREFASQLFISPSAIVRFTKKIGLTGYSDFKMKIASELAYFSKDDTTLVALDLPVASKQTVKDIAKTMMNLHSQTLLDIYLDLDLKNITIAGDLILHSDWITIFAKGESILAAEALHQKLLRIGFNSHLEALNGFQLVKPIRAKQPIGIIISQFGDSREMLADLRELSKHNIPTIYITSNQSNKAWQAAEIGIYVENNETLNKMGSFASRTAYLYVTDVLYEYVFSRNYDENVKLLSDYAFQSRTRNRFLGVDD